MAPVSATTRLRSQRLRRGLTLDDLAKECAAAGARISIQQLSRIERGMYAPRPKLRVVLAELLDLDPIADFKKAS